MMPIYERKKLSVGGALLGVAGLVAAAFVALMAITAIFGPPTFHGTHHRLYALCHNGLTPDQLDAKVDDMAKAANVSDAEAERMALTFCGVGSS